MIENYYEYIIPTYKNKSIEKSSLRYNVAKKQKALKDKPDDVNIVCEHIENILEDLGITHQTDLYWDLKKKPLNKDFYMSIKKDNPGMKDEKDIVWIKFTQSGYIGVVASSTDINFDITNTSGKIIKFVGEEWNKDFVIIIPLENMNNDLNYQLVESIIGNYLIKKGVPILDYYSHNI